MYGLGISGITPRTGTYLNILGLSCLRKSVSVVIIGAVHGGKLGIFLGVAKMTLVLRLCSYWEILLGVPFSSSGVW